MVWRMSWVILLSKENSLVLYATLPKNGIFERIWRLTSIAPLIFESLYCLRTYSLYIPCASARFRYCGNKYGSRSKILMSSRDGEGKSRRFRREIFSSMYIKKKSVIFLSSPFSFFSSKREWIFILRSSHPMNPIRLYVETRILSPKSSVSRTQSFWMSSSKSFGLSGNINNPGLSFASFFRLLLATFLSFPFRLSKYSDDTSTQYFPNISCFSSSSSSMTAVSGEVTPSWYRMTPFLPYL